MELESTVPPPPPRAVAFFGAVVDEIGCEVGFGWAEGVVDGLPVPLCRGFRSPAELERFVEGCVVFPSPLSAPAVDLGAPVILDTVGWETVRVAAVGGDTDRVTIFGDDVVSGFGCCRLTSGDVGGLVTFCAPGSLGNDTLFEDLGVEESPSVRLMEDRFTLTDRPCAPGSFPGRGLPKLSVPKEGVVLNMTSSCKEPSGPLECDMKVDAGCIRWNLNPLRTKIACFSFAFQNHVKACRHTHMGKQASTMMWEIIRKRTQSQR